MMKLKVFGKPHIAVDNQHPFTTALPLLIAAYIIVEHRGEAKREDVYDLFFPATPIYPAATGKLLYAQIWEQATATKDPVTLDIDCTSLGISSDTDITTACRELKDYQIIERFQLLKNNGIKCQLTESFRKYLDSFLDKENGLRLSDNARQQNIRKTCSQHLTAIRRFVKEYVTEEQLATMMPAAMPGKKGTPFIVRLECEYTELTQALENQNFEHIQAIYTGTFLEGIEEHLRATVWLSPGLRHWIESTRQQCANHIRHTLLNIVQNLEQQTDAQRIALLQSIQIFCQNRGLSDDHLQQAINAHFLPCHGASIPETAEMDTAAVILPQPVSTFEANRHHLLAKMQALCDFQLRAVPRQMNTHIVVETLDYQTMDSVPIHEHHRFLQILLRPSDGFMILVGEAGVGKSWFLYRTVQQLVAAAQIDANAPIPLLFHLADWTLQALPFEKWLKRELIQLGLAEKDIDTDFAALLEHKHCILLLDGFDNVLPSQRLNRLKTINGFIQKYGEPHLGGVIVASRPDEYYSAKQKLLAEKPLITLHFHTEATLQPLSNAEGCLYITEQSLPQSLDTLLKSEAFRHFLTTPLGLILLVESAKYEHFSEKTVIDLNTAKHNLIANYIHSCFKRVEESFQRKRQPLPYTEREVTTWLGYIARSMPIGSAFSVEGLSPQRMLTPKQQYRYQWGFVLFFGVIFGAMMGGVAGLIFGDRTSKFAHAGKPVVLPDVFKETHEVLVKWLDSGVLTDKIQLIISYASIGIISAVLMSSLTFLLFKNLRFSVFLSGYLALSLGTTGLLTEGSRWAMFVIIFYGILGFLMGWSIDAKYTNPLIIELHKDTRLSYEQLFEHKQDLVWGGLFIFVSVLLMSLFKSVFLPTLGWGPTLLQGVAIGVSFTLAYIFYRLKMQTDWQERDFLPRQKIKVALKRSVFMMFLIGGLITFLITGLGVHHLKWPGNLSFGLRLGMPFGIVIGLMLYGGSEVLKHLTLRLAMYQYEMAPWHYTRFLEHTKLLTFVKPQSSGYAFKHDWFQEYFQEIPRST